MEREQRDRLRVWLRSTIPEWERHAENARDLGLTGNHSMQRASDIRAAIDALSDESELHRRIGEAVMGDSDLVKWALEVAVEHIDNHGDGFDATDRARLTSLARVLREAGR